MSDAAKLLEDAMELSVGERLRLAGELLRSVDEAEDADAADVWVAEIEQRSELLANGTMTPLDGPEVHAELRAAVRAQRMRTR